MKNNKICIPRISPEARAVGFFNKYWEAGKKLKVLFMGGTSAQRDFVRKTVQRWDVLINLDFDWVDENPSDIRITFNFSDGSWSYIGKDALNIPSNVATMNFGWLDEAVILHEFGHALALGHEHQNPQGGIQWDVDAVIADLTGPPNNWSVNMVYHNVINPYSVDQTNGTKLDPESIMMYRIPAHWTLDGFSTSFNDTLSETDKTFVADQYPVLNLVDSYVYIFQKRSELEKMDVGPLVRMGKLLNLNVGVSMGKDKVINILGPVLFPPVDRDTAKIGPITTS